MVFSLPAAPEQDTSLGNAGLGWPDEIASAYDDPAVENAPAIPYSTGNEQGKYYGVDNGNPVLMAFRAYLDGTGTGASYYEVIYDRTIVFHKK